MKCHTSCPWIFLLSLAFRSRGATIPTANTQISRRDEWWPEGDWRAQLKCEGSVPEPWAQIDLPDNRYLSVAGLDEIPDLESRATYSTPRRLCAESQYGGSTIWNAGGWCGYEDGRTAHAVFTGQGHHGLKPADYRDILVFCTLRCQCLPYDVRLEDPPEEEYVRHPAAVISQSEEIPPPPFSINLFGSYSLKAAMAPPRVSVDFRTPPYDSESESGEEEEDEDGSLVINFGDRYIDPLCRGHVPSWPLPQPFATFKAENPEKYGSIENLCKAVMFGGEKEGNAGGVCVSQAHGKPRGFASTESTYEFRLEEFLAHPSLMWKNGGSGVAISAWCKRACTCQEQGNPFKDLPQEVWTITGRNRAFRRVYFIGDNVYTDEGGKQIILSETPFDTPGRFYSCNVDGTTQTCHDRGGAAAATAAHIPDGYYSCTVDGVERYCGDTAIEGSISVLQSTTSKDSTYGKECTRSSDCASKRSDPYRCVLNPGMWELAATGAEPFLPGPISRCLPRLATTMITGAGLLASKSNKLNGRGLVQQEEWACRCNETFASVACCEQLDGLVWDTQSEV